MAGSGAAIDRKLALLRAEGVAFDGDGCVSRTAIHSFGGAPKGAAASRGSGAPRLFPLPYLFKKQPWSSGRILACHAGDPSSILGGCIHGSEVMT